MDKKRIILIVLFLIVTAAMGYAIYRVFFAPEAPVPEEVPAEEEAGEFPRIEEGEVVTPITPPTELPEAEVVAPTEIAEVIEPAEGEYTRLAVTAPITSPGTDGKGGVKFYNDTDGKFYRLQQDGTVASLSDEVFYNVEETTWSPTKNESIIEYPDGSNIYYNFDTKEQVTLPKHWEEFSFSPQGDRISAKSIGLSPENRWLVSSDPQGNEITLIEDLGENADRVIADWSPKGNVVALSRTGETIGGYRQEVLLVGLHGENFKSITVEGRGLETQWSPTGERLLHSVYSARSDFKPELWIVNAGGDDITGSGRKLLNVNTWASKCHFADDRFVYCGVPETLRSGAAFAPEIADTTRDQLYRIDTQTGLRVQIPLNEYHTIDTIFTGDDGQTLYFTDKNKSGLYEIPL